MRIRIIDAFTSTAFSGNPAGVCLLDTDAFADGWPDVAWMQALAAELNQSETAFAVPTPSDPRAEWEIRWFTPVVEVRLCGHATLATVHALHSDGLIGDRVSFSTRRSGLLAASVAGDGSITLDFPAAASDPYPESCALRAQLTAALGVEPVEVHRAATLRDLLVVLDSEADVAKIVPDHDALMVLGEQTDVRAFICTAVAGEPVPDPAAGATGPVHFVSRFFAPTDGIPEDPVTGGAHTALAPFWSLRLGRERLTGRQLSRRGGIVETECRGDRVLLTGRAVTVLDGTLETPARPL